MPPYGACLLGSINLAALVTDPFTPQARLDLEALERLVPLAVRMLDNVIDVSRFPLPQQDDGGQGQAAHRARRHRAGRRADLLRRALRFARSGAADARVAAARFSASPISPRPTSPRRRAASRCSIATRYLAGETIKALPEDVRDRDRPLRHPQCAAELDRAHRHDLAAGRQRLVRHRAGLRLQPTSATCCSPTAPSARRASRITRCGSGATLQGRRAAARRRLRRCPDALARRSSAPCRRRRRTSSTARSPRPSTCRATSRSRPSRTSTSRPMRQGCKGCTTYRPNDVTGAVLEVKPAEAAAAVPALVPRRAEGQRGLHRPAARPARRICRARPTR